jgi:hypothetical protein
VKYTIAGGNDTNLDPQLVKVPEEVPRGRRRTAPTKTTAVVVVDNKENAKLQPKKKKRPKKQRAKLINAVVPKPKQKPALLECECDFPKEIFASDDSVVSDLACELAGIEDLPRRQYMLASPQRKVDRSREKKKNPAVNNSPEQEPKDETQSPRILPQSLLQAARVLSCTKQPSLDSESSKRKTPPSPESSSKRRAFRPHVTLEEVFQKGKRSATQFIQQVVSNKAEGDADLADDEASLARNSVASQTVLRKQLFLGLVNDLFQNEDVLEEDNLMDRINGLAKQRSVLNTSSSEVCFDADTVEELLSSLAEENKIMRSDGLIYSI